MKNKSLPISALMEETDEANRSRFRNNILNPLIEIQLADSEKLVRLCLANTITFRFLIIMNEVTTNGNIQLCYGIEQAIRYATIPLWIMRMNRYKISTSSLSKRTSIKIKNPHSIGKKVSGCLTPDTFFTF